MLVMQRPKVEAIGEPEDDRQRFAIGPLEPGFGHTIGTSLRRALLSSIPGAAVIQVRFDDADHEFTTIKGVVEDVTDILLNLKDLVLRCHSPEPVTLRVDQSGPCQINGKTLNTSTDVEVVNSNLLIAQVNKNGRFRADITVSQGHGYVSAEAFKDEAAIGTIPVDAIFSPVRRVAFTVEPTRVEQSTDYDQLVLDIETDGSITPAAALASAGATLRTLLMLVEELNEESSGLLLPDSGTASPDSSDTDLPIEYLELSERPRNCLKRAHIITLQDLLARSEEELLEITNFGQKSLDEVNEKLDEMGLALAPPS